MNRSVPLPKGYKSLQDFLLHYHKNNITTIKSKPAAQKSEDGKSIPSDSVDSFKVLITMSKIPERSPQLPESSSRNFYERASPSDISPQLLMNPNQLSFVPVAKF